MFVTKLNKSKEPHVIKDEVVLIDTLKDGVIYGKKVLNHGNVVRGSLEIWTEPDRGGENIETAELNQDEVSPWKYELKVYGNRGEVYVTYETTGDQVDGDDINHIQAKVLELEDIMKIHKEDKKVHIREGAVDGGEF